MKILCVALSSTVLVLSLAVSAADKWQTGYLRLEYSPEVCAVLSPRMKQTKWVSYSWTWDGEGRRYQVERRPAVPAYFTLEEFDEYIAAGEAHVDVNRHLVKRPGSVLVEFISHLSGSCPSSGKAGMPPTFKMNGKHVTTDYLNGESTTVGYVSATPVTASCARAAQLPVCRITRSESPGLMKVRAGVTDYGLLPSEVAPEFVNANRLLCLCR